MSRMRLRRNRSVDSQSSTSTTASSSSPTSGTGGVAAAPPLHGGSAPAAAAAPPARAAFTSTLDGAPSTTQSYKTQLREKDDQIAKLERSLWNHKQQITQLQESLLKLTTGCDDADEFVSVKCTMDDLLRENQRLERENREYKLKVEAFELGYRMMNEDNGVVRAASDEALGAIGSAGSGSSLGGGSGGAGGGVRAKGSKGGKERSKRIEEADAASGFYEWYGGGGPSSRSMSKDDGSTS